MALKSASSFMPYPEEILQLPMFYSYVSKEEAESLIIHYSQGIGTFLIRPNGSLDPSFVSVSLSGPDGEVFKVRIFIKMTEDGSYIYSISPSLKFNNFSRLLAYYKQHKIYVKQHITNLYLLHPIIVPSKDIQNVLAHIHRGQREHLENPSVSDELRFLQGLTTADMAVLPFKPSSWDTQGTTRECLPLFSTATIGGFSQTQNLPSTQTPQLDTTNHGNTANKQTDKHFGKPRSKSESHISLECENLQPAPKYERRKTVCHPENPLASQRPDKNFMKYRPAMPLPVITEPGQELEYSSGYAGKEYFHELYQRLKLEEESCECGLLLKDSKLADGWVVHRSHDEATMGRIFYQRGDEETSWHIPPEILPKINLHQRDFLHYLYLEGGFPPPSPLVAMLNDVPVQHRQSLENKPLHEQAIPDLVHDNSNDHNSNPSSSLSSTSSSTSHQSTSSSSLFSLRSDPRVSNKEISHPFIPKDTEVIYERPSSLFETTYSVNNRGVNHMLDSASNCFVVDCHIRSHGLPSKIPITQSQKVQLRQHFPLSSVNKQPSKGPNGQLCDSDGSVSGNSAGAARARIIGNGVTVAGGGRGDVASNGKFSQEVDMRKKAHSHQQLSTASTSATHLSSTSNYLVHDPSAQFFTYQNQEEQQQQLQSQQLQHHQQQGLPSRDLKQQQQQQIDQRSQQQALQLQQMFLQPQMQIPLLQHQNVHHDQNQPLLHQHPQQYQQQQQQQKSEQHERQKQLFLLHQLQEQQDQHLQQ